MANPNCPKCKGRGSYMREDKSIQTCFDCLLGGDMDQHDEHLKDSDVKI
jgi:hypothetical protein